MSGPNFSCLYAPVPPTDSDRFLSNFQDLLSSPRRTTYQLFFIVDLRLAGGHDFVMLSLWEYILIAPTPNILEISA